MKLCDQEEPFPSILITCVFTVLAILVARVTAGLQDPEQYRKFVADMKADIKAAEEKTTHSPAKGKFISCGSIVFKKSKWHCTPSREDLWMCLQWSTGILKGGQVKGSGDGSSPVGYIRAKSW